MVILGPGPGDPRSKKDPKMKVLRACVHALLEKKQPFFAECLSHQVLCDILGFPIRKKDNPLQGVQIEISLFGKQTAVGFYNTFTAWQETEIGDVKVNLDAKKNEIYALQGDHFHSAQFHPESILSTDGFNYFKETFCQLVSSHT